MKISKIIFSALLSTLFVSCQQGSSKTASNNHAESAGIENSVLPVPKDFKEIKSDDINRECTPAEVQVLNSYDQLIQISNTQVDAVNGKRDAKAIEQGISAIGACDQVIQQILMDGPCRATKKTIVGSKISFYDGFRIDQKCEKTEKYLTAFDSRPTNNTPAATQPVVVAPSAPSSPSVQDATPVPAGSLRQCTSDEFSNLSSSLTSVDLANNQISKLGEFADWKYDSDAIVNASLGSKSCEVLISHHDQNPCERTITKSDGTKILRQYTGASLRQRCEKARSYFYEFVQNKSTLNFEHADLLLDVSAFSVKRFDTVPVQVEGCVIENLTDHAIDYSGVNQVVIKASRDFEYKIMVLETVEGLKIQCYGLKVDGPFSKREIVSLFKKDGTNMPLSYRLK